MNLDLFFGRFHPLIVHLPIGFLLLAAIMEVLSLIKPSKFSSLDKATSIALLTGSCAAMAAAIIGLLLASGGGYDQSMLQWHKWLGITLILFSFAGWLLKSGLIKVRKVYSRNFIFMLVVMVSITGHLGGNLTHGHDYLLVYAPEFVKNLAGMDPDQHPVLHIPDHPDSIIVFAHLVEPILKAKCNSCHNETRAQSDLIISAAGLTRGGKNGPVIIHGNAAESELFKRVTSTRGSKKFMPPKGEPLTFSELKIVEWWLNNRASFKDKLPTYKTPEDIQAILLNYHIDTKPKPYYNSVVVSALSEQTRAEMVAAGWMAKPLASGHHMLSVKPTGKIIGEDQFEILLKAREQITWLDLSNCSTTDNNLKTIGQLSNLTMLKLNNNPIGDEGIHHLVGLRNIESLNIYGTGITDKSVEVLKDLKSLRSLYVWQTGLSKTGLEILSKELPNTQIVYNQ